MSDLIAGELIRYDYVHSDLFFICSPTDLSLGELYPASDRNLEIWLAETNTILLVT